jgi:hypothetical protein
MKKSFLLLCFIFSVYYCFPQKTTFETNYFSPRDFGKGHNAETRVCVQDRNGILFFGNAGGLLQYDGVSWTFIPVKNQSVWIESLAISKDNVIYVGAQSEFGYLEPDQSGKLVYVSLSDQLDTIHRSFKSVVRLWAWKDRVAFQSEEALFLYSDNKLITILPETSFNLSFLIEDELYIRERDKGIMKLTGNRLQLVNGSESFKNIGVVAILERADSGRYSIITHENGFWSVDKVIRSDVSNKILVLALSFFFDSASSCSSNPNANKAHMHIAKMFAIPFRVNFPFMSL